MKLRPLILILIMTVSSGWVVSSMRHKLQTERAAAPQVPAGTPLYLPEGRYLRALSFGFEGFLGDILWFNTLNYFGRQISTGKDLKWFGHMCRLVTELKPKAPEIYEFCGSLLSWVAKDPLASNEILSRATTHYPESWRMHYFLGFNTWYFLEERQKAAQILHHAATLPDAPPFLASLAARLLASEEDPELAVQFLSEVLRNTKDPVARNQLIDRLRRAKLSADLSTLKKAQGVFEARTGRPLQSIEELLSAGIIKKLEADPFGGQYSYSPESKSFITSSGERGLEFKGKTAKTGSMKREFENLTTGE